MALKYSRTDWEDSPSTATPISADNLNNLEDGILECIHLYSMLCDENYVCMNLGNANEITTSSNLVANSANVEAAVYLYIAPNVTSIASGVFTGCTNLTNVYIHNTEGNVDIADGAFLSGVTIEYDNGATDNMTYKWVVHAFRKVKSQFSSTSSSISTLESTVSDQATDIAAFKKMSSLNRFTLFLDENHGLLAYTSDSPSGGGWAATLVGSTNVLLVKYIYFCSSVTTLPAGALASLNNVTTIFCACDEDSFTNNDTSTAAASATWTYSYTPYIDYWYGVAIANIDKDISTLESTVSDNTTAIETLESTALTSVSTKNIDDNAVTWSKLSEPVQNNIGYRAWLRTTSNLLELPDGEYEDTASSEELTVTIENNVISVSGTATEERYIDIPLAAEIDSSVYANTLRFTFYNLRGNISTSIYAYLNASDNAPIYHVTSGTDAHTISSTYIAAGTIATCMRLGLPVGDYDNDILFEAFVDGTADYKLDPDLIADSSITAAKLADDVLYTAEELSNTATMDSGAEISGTSTVHAGLCTVTAAAAARSGYGSLAYPLPVSVGSDTTALTADDNGNIYKLTAKAADSRLHIQRNDSGEITIYFACPTEWSGAYLRYSDSNSSVSDMSYIAMTATGETIAHDGIGDVYAAGDWPIYSVALTRSQAVAVSSVEYVAFTNTTSSRGRTGLGNGNTVNYATTEAGSYDTVKSAISDFDGMLFVPDRYYNSSSEANMMNSLQGYWADGRATIYLACPAEWEDYNVSIYYNTDSTQFADSTKITMAATEYTIACEAVGTNETVLAAGDWKIYSAVLTRSQIETVRNAQILGFCCINGTTTVGRTTTGTSGVLYSTTEQGTYSTSASSITAFNGLVYVFTGSTYTDSTANEKISYTGYWTESADTDAQAYWAVNIEDDSETEFTLTYKAGE